VFSAFLLLLLGIIVLFSTQQAEQLALTAFEHNSLYVMKRAANQIDVEAFKRLTRTLDDQDPHYIDMQQKLWEVKQTCDALYLYAATSELGKSEMTQIITGNGPITDMEANSPIGTKSFLLPSVYTRMAETKKAVFYPPTYIKQYGGWILGGGMPLLDSNNEIAGFVGLTFDANVLMKSIHDSQSEMLALGGFFLILGIGIMILFVYILFVPLRRTVYALREIVEGGGDLTSKIDIKVRGELAILIDSMNETLAKVHGMVRTIGKTSGSLRTSVFDLSSSAKQISTTANEQSASVSEITTTMEGNANLSAQMADTTREAAMLASETEQLSQKGLELRDVNEKMMDEIRVQNNHIISEIKNLTDMLTRIDEAIGIIDSIADQTKLIAFNASLEASSSGEAGARFSVVAGEIRRFADNVVDSTAEIKTKIGEVQTASQSLITEALSGSKQIEHGYDRMVEQKTVFEHIVANSQTVAQRMAQISDWGQQQELASSQILETLKEINLGVKQFVTATASTSKIADNLNGLSDELNQNLEQFETSTGGEK
jgi:methyl-accepting chemotaxis protein